MSRKRWILAGVAAVIVVAAVGLWATLHVAPPPAGYSSATEGVEFYPACGNTPLEYGGRTWYPIVRDDWSTPVAKAAAASGGRGVAVSVPMVAAPGPGDDVGTLYVYPHGIAYWVSDNGDLHTWLTLVPQTYNWVC